MIKSLLTAVARNDASALKTAHLLTKRGLVVSVLNGGIEGWVAAGHPLETAVGQV